jgi:predicted HicB family RNase H-like nuclease
MKPPKKKPHGNVGNKSASKPVEQKATKILHQRISPERKARWEHQAEREGVTLTAWVQHHLDAVCDIAESQE